MDTSGFADRIVWFKGKLEPKAVLERVEAITRWTATILAMDGTRMKRGLGEEPQSFPLSAFHPRSIHG